MQELSEDSEKSSSDKNVEDEPKSETDSSEATPPLKAESSTPEVDNSELIPASNNDENNYLADAELSGDDGNFDEAEDVEQSKVEVESNISKV